MSDRRLLKFKYKEGELLIVYEQMNGSTGAYDRITLESAEEPRNALREALSAMGEHLVEICEFPGSYRDETEIRSITCTYTQDVQGLVITGLRKLRNSNAPLIINSPHFTREPYNKDSESDAGIFSSDCADSLDELERRVFAYVDGERAQRELEFPDEQMANRIIEHARRLRASVAEVTIGSR